MCNSKMEKSDRIINSDISMLATETFNTLMSQIQNSSLNYHLQISPFSALVSIKKSFIKDKWGQNILPLEPFVTSCNVESEIKPRYDKLQQEFEQLFNAYEELMSKLTIANTSIDVLQKDNKEKDETIKNLEAERKSAREAAILINKVHNDTRISFENEKLDLFKKHKLEVKTWKRDLGKMTKKCINMERKLQSLELKTSTNTSRESYQDHFSQVLKKKTVVIQPSPEDLSAQLCYCSICATWIEKYVPEYFYGERINPTCMSCKGNDDNPDPFSSFPVDGMPSSLASHWNPSTDTEFSFNQFNLASMASMRSHYVRIPNPGDSFTAFEDLLQDYRVFLRQQRQELLRDCRQS